MGNAEYELNGDFKVFVDKFTSTHHITTEIALQQRIVREVETYYRRNRLESAGFKSRAE